jgi:hypothetical protein
MNTRTLLSAAVLLGLAATSLPAAATNYTVDCGSGGALSLVQTQLSAISGRNNTLSVTGTCGSGTLNVTGIDSLLISGLSMQGTLLISAATHLGFTGLNITGTISVSDHSSVNATNTILSGGGIQSIGNSSVTFNTLTLTTTYDPNTTTAGSGILCLQGSDCHFNSTTLSGTSSGDPTSPAIGIQVASTARLNFGSGTISGFDYGMHVWNNATALLNPTCGPLSISGNTAIGVYVRDGGVAKIEGLQPPVTSDCPGNIVIANNGNYGLLAEGGGLGFLYGAQVTGHAIDGVRVQDGSVVKVHSSTIDAATTSGRSAWVKSHSHLWFDEEIFGPTAGSSLAGPVCVTNHSSVDTDNSSTQITTINNCADAAPTIVRHRSPL